jgi:hypothetical protein
MTPAQLEEQKDDAEAIINAELARLGPGAPQYLVDAVIDEHLDDGWEWVDATAIGGPPQIVLTVFNPPRLKHFNCRCTMPPQNFNTGI